MVLDTETIDNTETDDGFNELRERLRQVMARRSMTMAAAAKLAGIGDSTVSAFMAGNYAGNNQRMADRLRIWLDAQDSMVQAQASLLTTIPFAKTKSSDAFMAALEYAQFLGDCSVIAGGAGVGKTTAAERYAATHPNVWLLTADTSLSKAHAILGYVADVLGVTETRSDRISRAIATRLAGTQGLLIIDEAQKMSVEGLDQLRSIHDRSKIGLTLIGNETVWSRLDGGGRKAEFAQLFSRVGMRVTASKPTSGDIEVILDAAGITEMGQRKLLRAIAAKPGALRDVAKTLRLARQVLEPDEALSAAHITQAWNRRSGVEA